ncbi:GDYXXLXY domain-containing protein [Psychroserpens burtonensis]|uniref:GDYXXLXY domain-containing protein n=1 Tax=Psychroserpens burtonensis TaxID=49278 RepID=A0A5C7B4A1_9FLAO|nr:GDYXXLXY domain-containing protein [Psychroserpens burtonensis]TXE15570.1 GDYXXLXY domain-containing protein [Psychroserpens burtonensis]
MQRKHIFILFIILAIAQIAVPAQMIFNREAILKSGTAFKFKTEPVDPSDPFKGKYISLNYELDNFKTKDTIWMRNQEVYISITNDSLGFAKVISASLENPKKGDFLKAKVNSYSEYDSILRFSLPFNEFYMEETKAYSAELAYREAQRDSLPDNTFALVYIKNGDAVLDNVFINEIPIATFIEK